MACIFKRGNTFWASYYVGKKQIKKSLGTRLTVASLSPFLQRTVRTV